MSASRDGDDVMRSCSTDGSRWTGLSGDTRYKIKYLPGGRWCSSRSCLVSSYLSVRVHSAMRITFKIFLPPASLSQNFWEASIRVLRSELLDFPSSKPALKPEVRRRLNEMKLPPRRSPRQLPFVSGSTRDDWWRVRTFGRI